MFGKPRRHPGSPLGLEVFDKNRELFLEVGIDTLGRGCGFRFGVRYLVVGLHLGDLPVFRFSLGVGRMLRCIGRIGHGELLSGVRVVEGSDYSLVSETVQWRAMTDCFFFINGYGDEGRKTASQWMSSILRDDLW